VNAAELAKDLAAVADKEKTFGVQWSF